MGLRWIACIWVYGPTLPTIVQEEEQEVQTCIYITTACTGWVKQTPDWAAGDGYIGNTRIGTQGVTKFRIYDSTWTPPQPYYCSVMQRWKSCVEIGTSIKSLCHKLMKHVCIVTEKHLQILREPNIQLEINSIESFFNLSPIGTSHVSSTNISCVIQLIFINNIYQAYDKIQTSFGPLIPSCF